MCVYVPVDNQKQSYKVPTMDSQQELQTTNYFFDEFEHDEDVFYCELKKQVLQLTADDDDDMIEARKQGLNNGPFGVPQDRGYYSWPMNKEDVAAPAWMLNLWRTGNGTGVFIPQIVQSKKKSRSRRKKNERARRTYRRVENV